MKERPIIFSGPMVRAILEGRKTQTRRIVNKKLPSGWNLADGPRLYHPVVVNEDGEEEAGPEVFGAGFDGDDGEEYWIPCRYGGPGDRLWVRETWRQDYQGGAVLGGRPIYKATCNEAEAQKAIVNPWRPSIHMPRWASRILLEITEVRVQRVQEISEKDAMAEGVQPEHMRPARGPWLSGPAEAFASLWDSIHGPGAWERNDWVWAITFRRVET